MQHKAAGVKPAGRETPRAAGTFQDTRSDRERPFPSQVHERKIDICSTLKLGLKKQTQKEVVRSPEVTQMGTENHGMVGVGASGYQQFQEIMFIARGPF